MEVCDRAHILERQHAILGKRICREQNRPLPNVELLRELKIRKLRLKEQLFNVLAR